MKMKEGKVCGIDARIFRISFTGELSFEINVPSRYGLFVWNEFMKLGKNMILLLMALSQCMS